MSEQQTETPESSTGSIEEAVSSTEEELQTEPEVVETPPEPESEELVLKRKTAERFDKLTNTVKDQQATIDQLRQSQNQALDYQDPGAPKIEDFDTDEEYWTARGAHEATKTVIGVINQNQATQAQATQAFTQGQQIQAHTGRVQAFQAEHADYNQVVGASMLNVMDQAGQLTVAAKTILEQPNSPAIEYHLASNPDIAMALNQAQPAQAGAMIARLSDQLTASPVNNAPPPPPITSEDTGTGTAPVAQDFKFSQGATFE